MANCLNNTNLIIVNLTRFFYYLFRLITVRCFITLECKFIKKGVEGFTLRYLFPHIIPSKIFFQNVNFFSAVPLRS